MVSAFFEPVLTSITISYQLSNGPAAIFLSISSAGPVIINPFLNRERDHSYYNHISNQLIIQPSTLNLRAAFPFSSFSYLERPLASRPNKGKITKGNEKCCRENYPVHHLFGEPVNNSLVDNTLEIRLWDSILGSFSFSRISR